MSLPKSNGQTVLITGINGYIASVLGHLLLSNGYSIRGTARKAASTEPLVNGAYKAFKERVEMYEVPDMTVTGAFDKAVKGVHGIFHTASPIDNSIVTYDAYVKPAVAGNLTLLNSALNAAGPQLKAVIVTSSVAAINNPPAPPGHVLTEKQFAHVFLDKANSDLKEGNETPTHVLYGASKTAAERALWEFKETKKPKWSISTVNPTVVIGPPVLLPSSPDKLNLTLAPIWKIFAGELTEVPPAMAIGAYVDVRDVASIHLWAYENCEAANGERYIAAAGFGPYQAAADILRDAYPDRRDVIPKGVPGEGYLWDDSVGVRNLPGGAIVSGEKAERVMGLKYRDFKSSILDTVKEFEKLL